MRIAVLGCGSIGRRHLRNLGLLGHSDLLAFDTSSAACDQVTKEFAMRCCLTLDDVWFHQPHAVLITAPTSLHLELAQTAANHGCHLFIEKPLSHSLDGIDSLLATATRRGLTTMVGCNMRFHPGPAQVKRLIEENEVGNVIAARIQAGSYLPDWRPGKDYRDTYSAHAGQGGGAILDCIHEIDLSLWYFGPGITVGAAVQKASSLGLEVDGLAELLIRHSNGTLTNVHLNFVQRDYRRCCQVIGDRGTIYWDFELPSVQVRSSYSSTRHYELAPEWNLNQMYMDEMAYFLRCIEKGERTFCTIEDGFAALQIALAARSMGILASTNQ